MGNIQTFSAVVATVIQTISQQPTATKRRRWLRFSLRALLVLIAVIAGLIWIPIQRANKQRRAIQAVERLGGTVGFDFHDRNLTEPAAPGWLRRLIGEDYFRTVTILNLVDKDVSDRDLEWLRDFPGLKSLALYNCPRVTDKGLAVMADLTQLTSIDFNGIAVKDAGLQSIARLKNLASLSLRDAQVTDAGMPSIAGLRVGALIDQTGGDSVFFHGCHIDCGYFLTGEHRQYDSANGVLGAVRVNRPFLHCFADCDRPHGWGAWELTARFDYLDFFDRDTPVGPDGQLVGIRLPEATFGVNWYLSDRVRLMFNYSYEAPIEMNTGASAARIYATRLEVFW